MLARSPESITEAEGFGRFTSKCVMPVAGEHFGGSMDAAVKSLLEAPATWHVAEFKTHNAKSFADLSKKGVQKAKPLHHAQMQAYMGLAGMKRAVYVAVCKDTDELHIERVEFDEKEFERLMERAGQVIFAAEQPPRVSEDPAWFACKFCTFRELCHGTAAPEVNCRTCVHSTPEASGEARWSCDAHGRNIEIAEQRVGCPKHLHFPALLERFAEFVIAEEGTATYKNTLTGATFGPNIWRVPIRQKLFIGVR